MLVTIQIKNDELYIDKVDVCGKEDLVKIGTLDNTTIHSFNLSECGKVISMEVGHTPDKSSITGNIHVNKLTGIKYKGISYDAKEHLVVTKRLDNHETQKFGFQIFKDSFITL